MQNLQQVLDKLWHGKIKKEETSFLIEQMDKSKPNTEEVLSDLDLPDAYWLYTQKTIIDHKIKSFTDKTKRPRYYLWGALSAACLLVFVLIFTFTPPSKYQLSRLVHFTSKPIQWIEYHNGGRTEKIFTLVDSTIVKVAANSSFKIPSTYNRSTREVYLKQGSVQFHVAKNKHKPFHVYYRQTQTTALGTIFIVNGKNTHHFVITLLEGKIRINNYKSGTPFFSKILYPNQSLTIQEGSRQYELKKMNHTITSSINMSKVDDATSTEDKQSLHSFHLNQCSMDSLLHLVQKETHIRIFGDRKVLVQKWFTGKIDFSQDWKNQLQLIGVINDLNIQIKKDSLIIQPK